MTSVLRRGWVYAVQAWLVAFLFTLLRHDASGASPTLSFVSLTNESMSCVTIVGSANPNGASTTVRAQYWVTNQEAFALEVSQNIGSGSADVPFELTVDRLLTTTNYFFQVIAQNSGGAVTSAVMNLGKLKPTVSLGAGNALSFDGIDDRVVTGTAMFSNFFSNFTIEFWVNPTGSRALTVETNSGISGTNGQRFAVFPELGGPAYLDATAAGLGISVGTNGVSVFEYSTNYFPSVLVYTNAIIGWTHVAVSYEPTPRLYINGSSVRLGFSTGKRVRPSLNLGGGTTNFGFFQGMIDEVRVWNPSRTGGNINTDRDRAVPVQSGLMGCLRLDEGFGPVTANLIFPGPVGVLSNGVAWVPSGVVFWPAGEATEVTARSSRGATLHGRVNPNGAGDATGQFLWGLTTSYGNTVSPISVPASWCPEPISAPITNLLPYTIYQFAVRASSSAGQSNSANFSFRTLEELPVALTLNATNLMPTNAVLQGDATSFAGSAFAWFEWGLTTSYGNVTVPSLLAGGSSTQDVSHVIGGLTPSERYHFRLVVSNLLGITYGVDRTFVVPVFSVSPSALPAQSFAYVQLVDTDNDGSLDAFLSTITSSITQQVWRSYFNLFTNASVGFSSGVYGLFDWGNYDNDGLPDLLIAGSTNGGAGTTIRLWRNNGGTFGTIASGLPSLSSSVAWCDYDNDGKLDVVLSGTTNGALSGGVCQLWRGTGFGSFTLTNVGLTNAFVQASWGDYDNDGWPDLLLNGLSRSSVPITQIWRNNRTNFTNINAGLLGLSDSKAAWGDYDNDGRLDFAILGDRGGDLATSMIYHNTNTGFESNTFALPRIQLGDVAWGDYDNDGALDLFMCGTTTASASGGVGYVLHNNGTNFTDIITSLPGLYSGSGSWGDFDRDGRLDLLIVGQEGSFVRTEIRRNHSAVTNTPPSAPTDLAVTVIGSDTLQFTWSEASDAQTPNAGLYYNLRVGTTPGGVDVVSPGSLSGASVTVPRLGVLRHTNAAIVRGLDLTFGTKYYWAVQAVDTALAASPFSQEAIIQGLPAVTTLPASGVNSNSATLNASVNPNLSESVAWFELGADTSYGAVLNITNLGNGGASIVFTVGVSNLILGATYHYRAAATNSSGTNFGADVTFIPQAPPNANTISAGDYASSVSATLTGSANPGGANTWVHFEFGLTLACGSSTATTSIGSGTNSVPVNVLVAGLLPGVTYHYRLVASNAVGVTYGPDLTFTAPSLPPLPNTAPTITSFTNVFTPTNTSTASLAFEVGDLESNVPTSW